MKHVFEGEAWNISSKLEPTDLSRSKDLDLACVVSGSLAVPVACTVEWIHGVFFLSFATIGFGSLKLDSFLRHK
jgi:hypothetical protein